jgi:hypothetical protein
MKTIQNLIMAVKQNYRSIFALLALLTLALSASYGVYTFQVLFVPEWVAITSAASFELTYIGLALAEITLSSKQRAMLISLGAVAVSIIYNSLSAFVHLAPNLLDKSNIYVAGALALLHGLPLALVAFFVADLIIHQQSKAKQSNTMLIAKQSKVLPAAKQSNDVAIAVAKAKQSSTISKADTLFCSACGYEAKSIKALNGHQLKHRK